MLSDNLACELRYLPIFHVLRSGDLPMAVSDLTLVFPIPSASSGFSYCGVQYTMALCCGCGASSSGTC